MEEKTRNSNGCSAEDVSSDALLPDKNANRVLKELKTKPSERNWAVTKLGVSTGTKMIGHNLLNIFRDESSRKEHDRAFYVNQAKVLANELGQLKGSVMKAGQMMSLYAQYFMPPEAVEVLSGLQDDTPHVDWALIDPVLRRELGSRRLAELEIEKTPIAAASLGQAHVAVRKSDGRKLCIKVQYPGVADAIDSDVQTIARLITMAKLVPRNLSLEPVLDEVREMLHREVDYERERRATEEFRDKLANDDRYVVPEVFPEYCTDRILTTSFEEGVHVQNPQVQGLSQSRRNRLGEAFVQLFLKEFFHWRFVQTDPHFGNYRIRVGEAAEEDKIVLLDFGASRRFPHPFVEAYRKILVGALEQDRETVVAGSGEIGLLGLGFPETILDSFAAVCFLLVEPFLPSGHPNVPPQLTTASGEYRWGASDLPRRVTETIAKAALSRHFRIPPREIVFLHRRMGGVFIMLATLQAELAAGNDVQQLVVKAALPE